jgi:hypothetical protein
MRQRASRPAFDHVLDRLAALRLESGDALPRRF